MENIKQRTQNEINIPEIEFLSKMEIIRDNKLTFGAYLLLQKNIV
jgi:hypothetical protein